MDFNTNTKLTVGLFKLTRNRASPLIYYNPVPLRNRACLFLDLHLQQPSFTALVSLYLHLFLIFLPTVARCFTLLKLDFFFFSTFLFFAVFYAARHFQTALIISVTTYAHPVHEEESKFNYFLDI